MNFSKKILAVLLVSSSLLVTGCGQIRIGYIDSQKIMTEAPQMKALQDEGKKKMEEAEKEAVAELEKNSNQTDEEKMKAQGDLQRKIMGINQSYASQIKHKFDEAMKDIAEKNNLDAVLDGTKDHPLVIKGGIDLTDEVIKKLQ